MSNKGKGVLIAGIGAVGVLVLSLASVLYHQPIPHKNPVDQTFSLYSDKRISQSAVSTNLDFQGLAFEPQKRQNMPFSNQIASVARSAERLIVPKEITEAGKEYGTWIWTPMMDMSPDYMDEVISGAKAEGINAIYVSIDSYLDIFTMPKGEERENLKNRFSDILSDFIKKADEQGIAVDAEAGWRNWAEEGNAYKPFAIANFVKNFNNERSTKLRGLQYDIEPYLLERYQKDEEGKADVLKRFIKLVDETEVFLENSHLKLSVVVPDFYDSKDKATPQFSYNGAKDHAFGHLINILDRKPGNSVIIMSYRNFAQGEDGSIEVSSNEMQTAKNRAYRTRIIIAQETGEFPPPYITFHATSKRYMLRELSKIKGVFGRHPNFGGLALHYANALLELK